MSSGATSGERAAAAAAPRHCLSAGEGALVILPHTSAGHCAPLLRTPSLPSIQSHRSPCPPTAARAAAQQLAHSPQLRLRGPGMESAAAAATAGGVAEAGPAPGPAAARTTWAALPLVDQFNRLRTSTDSFVYVLLALGLEAQVGGRRQRWLQAVALVRLRPRGGAPRSSGSGPAVQPGSLPFICLVSLFFLFLPTDPLTSPPKQNAGCQDDTLCTQAHTRRGGDAGTRRLGSAYVAGLVPPAQQQLPTLPDGGGVCGAPAPGAAAADGATCRTQGGRGSGHMWSCLAAGLALSCCRFPCKVEGGAECV